MAKSRRKKNYKLRKRVMRTIAALTMVMAVVVAAIPVENYGTMRASGIDREDVNLAKKASEYLFGDADSTSLELLPALKKYDSKVEEPYKNTNEETVQQIIGDQFIDAFKVWINPNSMKDGIADAMIAQSVFINNLERFDIHDKEYYGYIQINGNYRDAVVSAFSNETYKVAFSDSEVKYDAITNAGADGSLSFDAITGYKVLTDSPSLVISNEANGTITEQTTDAFGGNPYTAIKTASATVKVLETYASDLWTEHTKKIETYNNALNEYITTLDEISKKEAAALTNEDLEAWKEAAAGIEQLTKENTSDSTNPDTRLDNLIKLETTFADIYARGTDGNENGLPDIVDYAICQRMGKGASSVGLEKYELKRLNNTIGDLVYVPQIKANEVPDSGQRIDADGYLTSGQVNIKGIKSDAFNVKVNQQPATDKEVASITIPSSVEFIGERAFANSTYLKSVTITEDNCRILGDEAFRQCPNLESVNFTSKNSRLEKVGCMAFYNTKLNNITFPDYVQEIGAGCLYLSDIKEMTVVGYRNGTLKIEPYAFFGCDELTTVHFTSDNTRFEIGTAAFALTADQGGGSLEHFAFPSYMNQLYYEENGNCTSDYILAGRDGLKTVVLPGRLGNGVTGDATKVPDNTFAGCKYLESVEFPKDAYNATYRPSDSKDGKEFGLFRDVLNPDFYIRGPEEGAQPGSVSEPRKCTWDAVTGYKLPDGKYKVIPYVFRGSDGKDHMEIGAGTENPSDYLATIEIIEGTNNAILSEYKPNPNATDSGPFLAEVPETVGGYTITELGEGCFANDKVKNRLYKLVINDGTVQKINQRALAGCEKLQWVELGDSVKFIGEEAFAGCKSLENVVFSQTQTVNYGDNEGVWTDPNNTITIERDAFRTDSDYLTFHGAINPNYEPYKFAMSADGKNMLSGKTTGICYKTDAPMNLVVMRNEATGEATLIDYPHYEEIDVINKALVDEWGKEDSKDDYSIIDKFEEKEGLPGSTTGAYPDNYKSKGIVNEKDIVLRTLNISLPRGIDSVDSKAFYTNEANTDNVKYLDLKYEPKVEEKEITLPDGTTTKKEVETAIERKTGALAERKLNQFDSSDERNVPKLYSTYEGGKGEKYENTKPGLYSGYFDETDQDTDPYYIWGENGYNGHTYVERYNRGNDYLTTISLPDVKKLPDYAFDSCENLTSVSLGSQLAEVGALPFRDCKSLKEVNFPDGNTTFTAQNMILYKNHGNAENPDYEILECLEGRGSAEVGGSPTVGVSESDLLPNITSIAQDAFSNCTYIQEVNLKGTQVTKIPAGCFEGCSVLNSVTLPDKIEEVHDRAFTKLGENVLLKLYVPNKRCTLASGAFDGKTTVMIYGKKYENETTGEESACYKSWKQVIDALVKNNPTHDREYWENKVQFVDEGNEYIETFVDKDLRTIDICKINPKSPDNDREPKDALTAKDIPTAPEYTGLEFVTWMCRIDAQNDDGYEVLTGVKAGDPAFTNIKEDRMFIPNYKFNPSKVVSCGGTHKLNVVGAEYILRTGTGEMIRSFTAPIELDCAESITLMADTKNSTGKFLCWTVTCSNDEGDFTYLLTNASGEMTGFQMPHLQNADSVVTITAVYSDTASRCEVQVINGSGSGFYNGGDSVEISAYSPVNPRQTFGRWTADNPRVSFVDEESSTTTFVMPQLQVGQKVVVTASYKDFDPTEGNCELEVINGSGSGFYNVGEVVTISAYASTAENEVFDKWTTASTAAGFANASRATTTIIMPQLSEGGKITVTATYKKAETGDNNDDDNNNTDNKKKYKVTVNYGSGSGEYETGATVNITANAPESSSRVFSRWTTNNSGLGFVNANAVTTSFVMPAADVTVTANYKTRSSDDDDDDDNPPRRPGSNSNTTTVPNRPGNSTSSTTSTTGTVNNPSSGTGTTNNNNGNRIYITKNGISNTDVASLAVSGSTDNFIVKITESPEATAAVEQALTNTYGSLEGLSYLPMDISLYDSTGQNKITDSTGLNITVTMPIPDVLIQYGGNARVAAADNGVLQQITPRFTTIDGIACISFVPPHFSPYVIYVDTSNLVAGKMLDATPATGDPIHPKWFAAIGMACVSILLFVLSDGRKRKKYRAA